MLFLIAVEEYIATQNANIVTHLDNSLSFMISYSSGKSPDSV